MTPATLERKIPQRELAKAWGWSMTKLTRMVNRGEIPHLRIGKAIFFEASALDAWQDARRVAMAMPSGRRSRTQDCAELGIPTNHEFSGA